MESHQPQHEQLYIPNDEDVVHEIPPGYRFVPDDVQLIDDYLKVIVDHPESGGVNGLIFTVNLYGSNPDQLTAAHQEQCEKTWYFFTKRNRKYANGNRPDRAAGKGTGSKQILLNIFFRAGDNNKRVKIGRRITLDYYYKKPDGTDQDDFRSDWKMTEYRLDGVNLPNNYNSSEFCEWCLCTIYKSKAKKSKDDNPQVNLQVEAEPNAAGPQLIAPQDHNGAVAGELHTNFTGQSTAASSSGQNVIAQQQYSGHSSGGPGPSFIQQSTTMPSNNNAVWNPNNSDYMANATSGSMNGLLQYNTDALMVDQQDMYPLTGTMPENGGYVHHPLRCSPPTEFPASFHSNFSQGSSSFPDHFTSDWEFDVDFTFDDFDL